MASAGKQAGSGMTARTVWIGDEDWERLREMAFRKRPRVSASELVRDLISEGLEKRKQGAKA